MAGRHLVLVLGSALSLAAGCYQGIDQVGDDIVTTRNEEFNATKLQGIKLQGVKLQGIKLQGIKLQGVKLQGVKLQGVKLQGLKLQGVKLQGLTLSSTEFAASFPDGDVEVPRSGTDFAGAEFEISITNLDEQGIEVTEDFVLRFDDIYQDPNWDDVLLYDMSYRAAGSGEWASLCDGGASVIPLNNYWDEETGDRIDDADVVTFACTDAVLAKCVEWGYRPWADATYCEGKKGKKGKKDKNCDEVSLQDYHQACTRMARADYCGDGTPWTVNGTAIDIADNLSPQIQSPETDWTIEAEWTPDGATCLNKMRHAEFVEQMGYPTCFTKKNGKPKKFDDCGDFKEYGGLLRSAFDEPSKCKKGKKCK